MNKIYSLIFVFILFTNISFSITIGLDSGHSIKELYKSGSSFDVTNKKNPDGSYEIKPYYSVAWPAGGLSIVNNDSSPALNMQYISKKIGAQKSYMIMADSISIDNWQNFGEKNPIDIHTAIDKIGKDSSIVPVGGKPYSFQDVRTLNGFELRGISINNIKQPLEFLLKADFNTGYDDLYNDLINNLGGNYKIADFNSKMTGEEIRFGGSSQFIFKREYKNLKALISLDGKTRYRPVEYILNDSEQFPVPYRVGIIYIREKSVGINAWERDDADLNKAIEHGAEYNVVPSLGKINNIKGSIGYLRFLFINVDLNNPLLNMSEQELGDIGQIIWQGFTVDKNEKVIYSTEYIKKKGDKWYRVRSDAGQYFYSNLFISEVTLDGSGNITSETPITYNNNNGRQDVLDAAHPNANQSEYEARVGQLEYRLNWDLANKTADLLGRGNVAWLRGDANSQSGEGNISWDSWSKDVRNNYIKKIAGLNDSDSINLLENLIKYWKKYPIDNPLIPSNVSRQKYAIKNSAEIYLSIHNNASDGNGKTFLTIKRTPREYQLRQIKTAEGNVLWYISYLNKIVLVGDLKDTSALYFTVDITKGSIPLQKINEWRGMGVSFGISLGSDPVKYYQANVVDSSDISYKELGGSDDKQPVVKQLVLRLEGNDLNNFRNSISADNSKKMKIEIKGLFENNIVDQYGNEFVNSFSSYLENQHDLTSLYVNYMKNGGCQTTKDVYPDKDSDGGYWNWEYIDLSDNTAEIPGLLYEGIFFDNMDAMTYIHDKVDGNYIKYTNTVGEAIKEGINNGYNKIKNLAPGYTTVPNTENVIFKEYKGNYPTYAKDIFVIAQKSDNTYDTFGAYELDDPSGATERKINKMADKDNGNTVFNIVSFYVTLAKSDKIPIPDENIPNLKAKFRLMNMSGEGTWNLGKLQQINNYSQELNEALNNTKNYQLKEYLIKLENIMASQNDRVLYRITATYNDDRLKNITSIFLANSQTGSGLEDVLSKEIDVNPTTIAKAVFKDNVFSFDNYEREDYLSYKYDVLMSDDYRPLVKSVEFLPGKNDSHSRYNYWTGESQLKSMYISVGADKVDGVFRITANDNSKLYSASTYLYLINEDKLGDFTNIVNNNYDKLSQLDEALKASALLKNNYIKLIKGPNNEKPVWNIIENKKFPEFVDQQINFGFKTPENYNPQEKHYYIAIIIKDSSGLYATTSDSKKYIGKSKNQFAHFADEPLNGDIDGLIIGDATFDYTPPTFTFDLGGLFTNFVQTMAEAFKLQLTENLSRNVHIVISSKDRNSGAELFRGEYVIHGVDTMISGTPDVSIEEVQGIAGMRIEFRDGQFFVMWDAYSFLLNSGKLSAGLNGVFTVEAADDAGNSWSDGINFDKKDKLYICRGTEFTEGDGIKHEENEEDTKTTNWGGNGV